MADSTEVGIVVYHQEYGKGEILMCSEDKRNCLVYFGFAIWVRKEELKRRFVNLRMALRPVQFSCMIMAE